MKLALSSGHGLKIRGAADILDEVNEARRIVEEVARVLTASAIGVVKFHALDHFFQIGTHLDLCIQTRHIVAWRGIGS